MLFAPSKQMNPGPVRWFGVVVAVLMAGLAGCGGEPEADSAAADREALSRQLKSLPYVTSSPVRPENKGLRSVVGHDSTRAYPGLNLYGSLTYREAYLRDMTGELVHTWSAEGLFTDRQDFPLPPDVLLKTDGLDAPGLTVAEIHGGYLLAIESLSGLVKLDWHSNVVFALPNRAHHDVDTAPDGSIYVLTAVPRWVETGNGEIVITDDIIQRLSPGGELLEEYSIFEILAENQEQRRLLGESLRVARYWFQNMDQWEASKIADKPLPRAEYEAIFDLYEEAFVKRTRTLKTSHQLYVLYRTPADILHCNTLSILAAHPGGLWPAGAVMVSVRNLDLVVVLDLAARRVLWAWGPGTISRQHQPSAVGDGKVLLFNNGTAVGRSQILELDPVTGEVRWSYGDTPETRFFSGAMGGVQRLPNGNTLITDSAIGRVLEVDPEERVVWDFFNPAHGYNPFGERSGEENIESIYRMVRVSTGDVESMVGYGEPGEESE